MRSKDGSLILIIILLLSGVYLLWPNESQQPRSADSAPSSGSTSSSSWKKIEKSIDQHMKLGRHSEELRRDLTAVENQLHAPMIDPAKIDPLVFAPNEPLPLKLNAEDAAAKAYRDTFERNRGRSESSLTPEQRITHKLNRDQWEKEYRDAYEKEYIRAYIENARKAGYEVKLNSKGEIVEVVDVGTNEPVRFPQSVDESGEKATSAGSQ